MPSSLSRADILRLAGAATLVRIAPAWAQETAGPVLQRSIPSTGEKIAVIGCGTWRGFDVGQGEAERTPRRAVLEALFAAGGTVIDSSPMYGAAEGVVGDLLATMTPAQRPFLATKVWTQGRDSGIAQMKRSMALLRTDRIDLMQIHNLVDWRAHLPTLRQWKADGRIRYLGITHYTASAHDALMEVMRAEPLDFVQVNYSADDRAAARQLLPLAAERGIAVLVNLPFGGGDLLRRLSGKPLPAWAADIGCESWAQILLKFALAHSAVTCVIPGTGNPAHMRDNMRAGRGALPDADLQGRIVAAI
jgi:diketogulonate reductase-like aldo/keto reductase